MIRKSSNKLSNLFMLALALLVIIKTVFCSGGSVGDNGAPNPSLDNIYDDEVYYHLTSLAGRINATTGLKRMYAACNLVEAIFNIKDQGLSNLLKVRIKNEVVKISAIKDELQHFLSKQGNCESINLTNTIFTQKELDMTIDAVKSLMYYLALFPYPYNPGKESKIGNISGTAIDALSKQFGDIMCLPSDYLVYDRAPLSVQKKADSILPIVKKEMTDIIEQLKEYKNIQVTFTDKDYKNTAAQSVLIGYEYLKDIKKKNISTIMLISNINKRIQAFSGIPLGAANYICIDLLTKSIIDTNIKEFNKLETSNDNDKVEFINLLLISIIDATHTKKPFIDCLQLNLSDSRFSNYTFLLDKDTKSLENIPIENLLENYELVIDWAVKE
ncbi:hypothetical protein NEOKW01_0511 [Nematocida sp. AWRm80]|nr:hypothetical protein NEOKW01_0511 [Nematocida sp. AWRm80]